jgi:methionine sulfoxide reductase heme-binding subunit
VTTQLLWFTARGSGIVSLILFSVVACLGLMTVARAQMTWWPRFLTVEVHRSLALLSVAFLAVHILAAVLDPFTHLGLLAAVLPLASSYRPVQVGLGVISLYLATAIIITSLLRDRIGHTTWRFIHWSAYAAWPLAVLHSITAGSDGTAPWMLAVTGLCVFAVGVALFYRLQAGDTNRRRLPAVASGTVDPIPVEPAWRND